MFNAQWLNGNANTLKDPGSVILTKKTAEKFFGDWKNAEGRFIKLGQHNVAESERCY
jgi:hypothetical protein